MPRSSSLSLPHQSGRTGLMAQFRAVLVTALTRRRDRAMLARLDAHLLRDIGVDPAEAFAEARKPCWRA